MADDLDFVVLNVPFAEKDLAKAAGARWDAVKRKWTIHLSRASELRAFWPDGQEFVIQAGMARLARSNAQRWQAAVGAPHDDDNDDDDYGPFTGGNGWRLTGARTLG